MKINDERGTILSALNDLKFYCSKTLACGQNLKILLENLMPKIQSTRSSSYYHCLMLVWCMVIDVNIWIAIILLCGVLVALHYFLTWYIQFIYKKVYLNHKQAIDEIVNNTVVPSAWKKYGKKKCLSKIGALHRFVKQDRFYKEDEKALIIEELNRTKMEWADCSESFFTTNG